MITEKQAIDIAEKDAGFLGTWTYAALEEDGAWHIRANSRSANPPQYYVIDGKTKKILVKISNSDDPAQSAQLDKYFADFVLKKYNIALQADSSVLVKNGHPISYLKAISIAMNTRELSSTWLNVEFKDGQWHLSGTSKSANPGYRWIVDATTGKIVEKGFAK